MELTEKIWPQFEEFLAKQLPTISIGKKDKAGNLLVLGGYKADLYRTPIHTYLIRNSHIQTTEEAIEAYNQANSTKLPLNYISQYFEPWYQEVSNKVLIEFQSESEPSRPPYKVRMDLDGNITCNCMGFIRHKHCWHTDAVKFIKEKAYGTK